VVQDAEHRTFKVELREVQMQFVSAVRTSYHVMRRFDFGGDTIMIEDDFGGLEILKFELR